MFNTTAASGDKSGTQASYARKNAESTKHIAIMCSPQTGWDIVALASQMRKSSLSKVTCLVSPRTVSDN